MADDGIELEGVGTRTKLLVKGCTLQSIAMNAANSGDVNLIVDLVQMGLVVIDEGTRKVSDLPVGIYNQLFIIMLRAIDVAATKRLDEQFEGLRKLVDLTDIPGDIIRFFTSATETLEAYLAPKLAQKPVESVGIPVHRANLEAHFKVEQESRTLLIRELSCCACLRRKLGGFEQRTQATRVHKSNLVRP